MNIHPVFSELNMKVLNSENVDVIIEKEGLKIIFLWGINCPNCEVAKNILLDEKEAVLKFEFEWYQCNLYEDFAVGTKFGVYGIPVFFFYDGLKKIGRITSFPDVESFLEVLKKVQSGHLGP